MSARKRIMEFMNSPDYRPMTAKGLLKEFQIEGGQRREFKDLLKELQEEGMVFKNTKGKYGLPEKMDIIVGRIEGHPDGFGFLISDDPTREDVYISRENMNGAMHNDKVFLRIKTRSKGKKQEGVVVQVIERVNHQIVGNFEKNRYFGFVVPDNKRIFYDVYIPREEINGAKMDQKVVAEISSWPDKKRNPEGRIVEILGHKNESGVDIEAIIRQLELPRQFPAEVEKEAEGIPLQINEDEIKNRRDLRQLPVVTIDGADAKDLDDAVSIEELEEGVVKLGVHIADVSHYVTENYELDKEAFNRGTSIYLVDRVIPMLPPRLSNGICSLNPREDRLTLSVFITYQLEPLKVLDHEITSSVINSNYRMTYDEVTRILLDEEPELIERYADFVSQLQLMNNLREKLRKARFKEGSINFDFPEIKVVLDDKGKPVALKKRRHGVSEQLIEEFMIAANQTVAKEMSWREIPFIYRVHDRPDSDRLLEFNEFIHNFGYHLKGMENEVHPRTLQELLNKVVDKPEERVINTMLLRSMKQAVYTPYNIGHFGLALEHYTHFTSPIRRYPDLIVHRIVKALITKGNLPEQKAEKMEKQLYQVAEHSSLQERRAMEAERDSVDLKKIEFMKDRIGEVFEGIINGVTHFGLFVELENTVEGLVHVEAMKDDYYHFNEKQMCLVGEATRKVYRFGDSVKVRLDGVNLDERQIDFVLVED